MFRYEAVDNQDWALISTDVNGHEFWVAVMAGEDLPVTDYKDLYLAEQAKVKKLNEEVLSLGKQIVALEESYATANAELDKVKTDLATAEKKIQIVKETVA